VSDCESVDMNNFGVKDLGMWLKKICEKLLKYDPDIVEIIQFGSSVYAPEYARDVDILVITRRPKDYNVCLDAVDEISPSFNIDVIVVEPTKELKENFIRGVLGAFNMLYGSGEYIPSSHTFPDKFSYTFDGHLYEDTTNINSYALL